ncbi:MAG: hypothetical protein OXI81_16705, partial [Paracoccaceae bacterium]|nr:hypothetical protein [Paracoccaceae bacterium]
SVSRSRRMAKSEGSRLPGGTAAASMRQRNVSLPVSFSAAPVSGSRPSAVSMTASLASRVFELRPPAFRQCL